VIDPRRLLAALALALALPTISACKPADTEQRAPTPIQAEISIAPVVDDHPWVIAFLTEISIAPPPSVDARLEGRTGPQGLRHPEPIIESETREALAKVLANYKRQRPPELHPVWQPDPFGPNERVTWRLYFIDTSKAITLDPQARASLDPHDHAPSVHLNLSEAQRQQFQTLTTTQVGRRIAIVVEDELLMLPVVMEPIPDGKITLITNPHQDPNITAPALFKRLTTP
jgi:hypothetical protein